MGTSFAAPDKRPPPPRCEKWNVDWLKGKGRKSAQRMSVLYAMVDGDNQFPLIEREQIKRRVKRRHYLGYPAVGVAYYIHC